MECTGGAAIFATHDQGSRIERTLAFDFSSLRGFCEASGDTGRCGCDNYKYDSRRLATRRASCRGRESNTPQSTLVTIFAGAGDFTSSLRVGRRCPTKRRPRQASMAGFRGARPPHGAARPTRLSPHLDDARCFLGGDVTDVAATGRIPSLPSSASSAVGSSRTRQSNDTRGLNGERALHQALSQSVLCAYQRSHAIPRV